MCFRSVSPEPTELGPADWHGAGRGDGIYPDTASSQLALRDK